MLEEFETFGLAAAPRTPPSTYPPHCTLPPTRPPAAHLPIHNPPTHCFRACRVFLSFQIFKFLLLPFPLSFFHPFSFPSEPQGGCHLLPCLGIPPLAKSKCTGCVVVVLFFLCFGRGGRHGEAEKRHQDQRKIVQIPANKDSRPNLGVASGAAWGVWDAWGFRALVACFGRPLAECSYLFLTCLLSYLGVSLESKAASGMAKKFKVRNSHRLRFSRRNLTHLSKMEP